MSTLLLESAIEIPSGVEKFDEFQKWVASGTFPERGRIDYINGRIEVDEMVEDPTFHGLPKVEIARVLANRIKQLDWGDIHVDATRVACPAAQLSVEPDIVCVSNASMGSGRVVMVPAQSHADQFLELEGSPDLVVEVLSHSSVSKDQKRLREAYSPRRGRLHIEILQRGDDGYAPAEASADGCQRSSVMQAAYRLEQRRRNDGRMMYDLLERPNAGVCE